MIPPERVSALADLEPRPVLLARVAGALQAPLAAMAGAAGRRAARPGHRAERPGREEAGPGGGSGGRPGRRTHPDTAIETHDRDPGSEAAAAAPPAEEATTDEADKAEEE